MIGLSAHSPLDLCAVLCWLFFLKEQSKLIFLLKAAMLSAILVTPYQEMQWLFDTLSNIGAVTGAARELGLLCRERANRGMWASAIAGHEQSGGHSKWGTKLMVATDVSVVVRGHEMMKERHISWTVEG